jgi:hypothetical protein
MRFIPCALLLFVGFAASSHAADVTGNWKVHFVSGTEYKTIGGAEFEFKVEGNKLAGTASVGHGWPGVAPISKGTIDGDQVSFAVDGELPSSSGYPRMRFVGTVHGDEIELTMKFFYSDESRSSESEFKGKRVTK